MYQIDRQTIDMDEYVEWQRNIEAEKAKFNRVIQKVGSGYGSNEIRREGSSYDVIPPFTYDFTEAEAIQTQLYGPKVRVSGLSDIVSQGAKTVVDKITGETYIVDPATGVLRLVPGTTLKDLKMEATHVLLIRGTNKPA